MMQKERYSCLAVDGESAITVADDAESGIKVFHSYACVRVKAEIEVNGVKELKANNRFHSIGRLLYSLSISCT
jgi:hypothetical protein